ncbi:glucose-1-phosphate adenylyltransferase [Candidatus Formimonas warabiya]|uniref:Glucose-1-phosphate adenylyltransferase n=1 Tax=Formimonas warabiya TaxID=1761012 RepID=A0A3G1L097_FORW1|nr:glucose-1-phosphate adenylyltransferase [Candidatus Formimonas warabiya]ATW28212.1 glucose-1-phosphate adenylyltransferase [Candidatus Formimonas warabiya]
MKKEWIALVMAGGQGTRLGFLTKRLAKPAVPFGGKYRIIDFTLSNCSHSGIDTVGVLTQYEPLVLNSYIGSGWNWDLHRTNGGVTVLPPYVKQQGGQWYQGTANAVYQNIEFVDLYNPEYLLVLSGDHVYKMDYSLMLEFHKEKKAAATVAVIQVPWEEAGGFGIMKCQEGGRIVEFEEKPAQPKSDLASMGVYIFNWSFVKQHLQRDNEDAQSAHDFGKNVIPALVKAGEEIFAYRFHGYWKDVGTIESYWQASMDLLVPQPALNLNDPEWRIYSENPNQPAQFIGPTAKVTSSLVNEGCVILGEVDHSVLFPAVTVGPGSVVKDSILMPNVKIGANVRIERAIVDEDTVIADESRIFCHEPECYMCCSATDCVAIPLEEKNKGDWSGARSEESA